MTMFSIALAVGVAVVAILAIALTRTLMGYRIVVPTNMVHIVQSSRKTTSYGKDRPDGNVYYAWPPHLPRIGVTVTVLPESVFQIELNNYEAYDSGRLPFRVDVRGFFRVSDSNQCAHRVSTFEELEAQMLSVMQGAVRRVLGTNPLESIMSDRAKLGNEFTTEVDPQLQQWGVQSVKAIEFMDIRDHEGSVVIANIMAKEKSRIDKESRMTVAANQQAAQQAEIDAAREVQLRKTDAEQQVGQRQAERDKQVGLASQTSQQEVLVQTKVTAQRQMEVKQVNSVQQADIDRQVAEVEALQSKNVAITKAEGEASQTQTIAEGQLEASKRQAEGIRVTGVARADAEKAMQLAPIQAQIELAKEIGSNDGYQTYLIRVKQVEAGQAVGIAQADALKAANIRVIATGGTITGGVGKVADILSPAGGVAIGSMLEGLAETDAGKAVLDRVTNGGQ